MNYKHTLLFLLLLIVSISPVVAANSPMAFYYSNLTTIPQPVTGASGMWLFNEGQGNIINDVSGNSKDGVVNGTVTWDSSGMITGTTGYVNLSNPAGLNIGANPMTQVLLYSPYYNNTYTIPFGDTGTGAALYQDYLLKLSLNQIQVYYNPAGVYRALTGEKTIISGAPNAIIGVTPNLTLFSISNLTSTYTNTVGGSTRVHAYAPRYIGYSVYYGISRGTYHGTILYPFPLTGAQTTQLQKWANWYYDTRGVRFVQTPKAPMYEAGSGPLAVSFTDSSSKSTASRVWNITPLGGSPTTFSTAANPEHLFWSGNYTVSLTVYDSGGTPNTMSTWINVSGRPDPTPPNSITGLTNTTPNCNDVTWTWTNPTDADYSHQLNYKNDVAQSNIGNGTTSISWIGITPATDYTFSSKTVDLTGNINATWMNQTVITPACESIPDWCGRQDVFFYNATGDLPGIRKLNNVPEKSLQTQITSASITSSSGESTLGTWITDTGSPGTSVLAPGSWDFRSYFTASNSAGTTSAIYRIFNQTPNGTKTWLFFGSAITDDLDTGTIPKEHTLSYARRNYTTFYPGDRLGIQINVSTNSASPRTVTMDMAGNTNASMVSIAYFLCPSTTTTTSPVPVVTWQPEINPPTDYKTDPWTLIKDWWWFPVTIVVFVIIFGGRR